MSEQRDYDLRKLVTTGADGFYRLVLEGGGNLGELSRVYSGHREDRQTRMQVFRDESLALDWLNKSDTQPW